MVSEFTPTAEDDARWKAKNARKTVLARAIMTVEKDLVTNYAKYAAEKKLEARLAHRDSLQQEFDSIRLYVPGLKLRDYS